MMEDSIDMDNMLKDKDNHNPGTPTLGKSLDGRRLDFSFISDHRIAFL